MFSDLEERPVSKHVLKSFRERIALVTAPHPFLFTVQGLCSERSRENWTVQKMLWPFGQWKHKEFNNIWSFKFSTVWKGRYGHKCALIKQTTFGDLRIAWSVFMPFGVFQKIDSNFFTWEWTEETKESKHIHHWTQSPARQLWDSDWLIYWAAISVLRRSRRLSADNSRLIGIS